MFLFIHKQHPRPSSFRIKQKEIEGNEPRMQSIIM